MAYDLERFKKAQTRDYKTALAEIKDGFKETHWMWYIFPQLEALGFSEISHFYGIKGIDEARAYIADEVLKSRLVEISKSLLSLESSDATQVMGSPDDMKLRSCMTLFVEATPENSPEQAVFKSVLEKFFGGKPDEKTLELLRAEK